jgi:hypothetical protein
MGELDPDFPDPRAEAEWIAQAVRGDMVMVPEAGYCPVPAARLTANTMLQFVHTISR